jgi:hypothetical protein
LVAAFEYFAEFYELAFLHLALFLIAVIAYLYIIYSDVQNWYQDCRLLDEAARVQFFWALAGLPRSVADEHQAHELGEGSWLYAATKAIALQGLSLAYIARSLTASAESSKIGWAGRSIIQ